MIFNGGPNGNISSSSSDFFIGSFDPARHLKIKFGNNEYVFFTRDNVSSSEAELIEDQNGYLIFLKTDCYLNFVKKTKNVDICVVGGGGRGGARGSAHDGTRSSGGGGGAGGQVLSFYSQNLSGVYQAGIGAGGKTTEEKKNGGKSFFNSGETNYEALGGFYGENAEAHNNSYGGTEYYAGHGGNQDESTQVENNGKINSSSAGGNSNNDGTITGYNYTTSARLNGDDGEPPQRIFDNYYFTEFQDNIYLAAGGGGGSSHNESWKNNAMETTTTGEKQGQKGTLENITTEIIYEYGDGGNGGSHALGTGAHVGDRAASDGNDGVIILRIKK